MMKQKSITRIVLLFLMLFVVDNLTAQVTIGSVDAPRPYSVLEISTKEIKGGLRMPHLTTSERNALNFTSGMDSIPNQGLTIYNTDNQCIEYWNNNKWVSLCLGTANISMTNSCGGIVDAENPPTVRPADDSSPRCVYTPTDSPSCIVPSGQAYQVYLTAGGSYSALEVDELTSAFSISFQPNNSSNTRTAVVRVVNNCSGEFQDFLFQQAGAPCPNTTNPILNINTASICSSGKAFVHVTNAVPGVNYVWTFGNVIIKTGTYLEADRVGVYQVYPDLLGCGTPATFTVTSNMGSMAAPAPEITATNSGLLCNGGTVVLTATKTSGGNVKWFHDGVPYATQGTSISVSSASAAGEWFATVSDGTCFSASSNKLLLIDQTSGSTALPSPIAKVNGQPLNGGSLTICQNGTLALEVTNVTDYPAGTSYEWFLNGTSIGKSSKPNLMYAVPANITNITLSVQVSNMGINCPNTAVSETTAVSLSAPTNTSINNGTNLAYICGNTPALLVANFSEGTSYEWYLDGNFIATTPSNQYNTSAKGVYTVRYQNAQGCWSKMSAGITVSMSNVISMQWDIQPEDAVLGQISNISVRTAPAADNIKWTATGGAKVIPFAGGLSAAIEYPNTVSDVTITVDASNACGTYTLSKTINVAQGCVPVTSANITPNGATLTAGGSQTFTATAINAESFEWKLNGNVVGGTGNTYTYNDAVYSSTPYTLSVTARRTTDCISSISTNTTITVKPNLSTITPDASGSYNLKGTTCFDVNMTSSDLCGLTTSRKDAFASTLSFDYIFTNTKPFSNLKFYTDDPSVIVSSTTTLNEVCTVTFRDDIREFIQREGTKAIQVVAVFNDNNGLQKKLAMTLDIQDCSCCGAYTAPGEWKNFMCYNLGADTSLNPFIPAQGLNGNHYQWGRSTIVADVSTPPSVISGWNTTAAANGSWSDASKTANDPCPTGYRIPTNAQWQAVIKNNQTTSVGSSWGASATNFSTGYKIGSFLYLPSTGYREAGNGGLTNRGTAGCYWTTTPTGGNTYYLYFFQNGPNTTGTSRNYGLSIRCISE